MCDTIRCIRLDEPTFDSSKDDITEVKIQLAFLVGFLVQLILNDSPSVRLCNYGKAFSQAYPYSHNDHIEPNQRERSAA